MLTDNALDHAASSHCEDCGLHDCVPTLPVAELLMQCCNHQLYLSTLGLPSMAINNNDLLQTNALYGSVACTVLQRLTGLFFRSLGICIVTWLPVGYTLHSLSDCELLWQFLML